MAHRLAVGLQLLLAGAVAIGTAQERVQAHHSLATRVTEVLLLQAPVDPLFITDSNLRQYPPPQASPLRKSISASVSNGRCARSAANPNSRAT